MGTIVGLEGGSPLYNQVLEFNPISPDIIIPDLVGELGEKSDDAMTYTFKIRQGGKWSRRGGHHGRRRGFQHQSHD